MNGRDEIALARRALERLSDSRADDRESWIHVGMALHSVSPELLADWDAWSKKSAKYKDGDCARAWRSFRHDKARSRGLGSLVQSARDDGGDQSFGKNEPALESRARAFASVELVAHHVAARSGGTLSNVWSYLDAAAHAVLWVARIDMPGINSAGKPEKTFRPIRRGPEGFEIGDPPGALPIYRLPEVVSASVVYFPEGEKAAEAGRALEITTTTTAHGAQSPGRSDLSPLAGKTVRLLPDRDSCGAKYVITVARLLSALSPPASLSVIVLPGLPAGGDLHDWLAARRAAGQSDADSALEFARVVDECSMTVAEFARTVPGAAKLEPAGTDGSTGQPPSTSRVGSHEPGATADIEPAGSGGSVQRPLPEFAELVELPQEVPLVAQFDYRFVPLRLQAWVRDIAERMQCPADFLFVSVMVALGAVIGRKVGIRPKCFDNWTVVPNLWGAVIGRPSVMKSPAIAEALKPLQRMERTSKDAFAAAKRAWNAEDVLHTELRKVNRKALAKAIENDSDETHALAQAITSESPPQPTRRRLLVNDTTVEKLGEILAENPNGVLVHRDELIGFLKSLDKDGQEGSRAFYLQAWNGDGTFTYDRIERGTIDIDAAIVSVLGSIQPGPLDEYLRAATNGGAGDDGLMQRFQLVVSPDKPKAWRNVDKPPDKDASRIADEVFRDLDALDVTSIETTTDTEQPAGIPFLRFDESAQELFNDWRAQLEARLLSGVESESFEAHLAKYRSLVPSLALIYHLVDSRTGPISSAALERSIAAVAYLETHARRIYASTITPEFGSAWALAKRILKGDVLDRFVLRSVYQKGWARIGNAADADRAASVLSECGWIAATIEKGPVGPAKTVYLINPQVLARVRPARRCAAQPDGHATHPGVGSEAHEMSRGSRGGTTRTTGFPSDVPETAAPPARLDGAPHAASDVLEGPDSHANNNQAEPTPRHTSSSRDLDFGDGAGQVDYD